MRDLHLQLLMLVVGLQSVGVGPVVAASLQTPTLVVTFPAQHSRWQVSALDGLLPSLPVHFQTRDFRVPRDGFLLVTGDSVSDGGYRHTSDANSLVLGGVDPGSHFWKLQLRAWNESAAAVAEATLHVDVVADVSDERSAWSFTLQESDKRPIVLVNPRVLQSGHSSNAGDILPVCYVSSTASAFDGQRRMWLQVMEGLGARSSESRVELQFVVKTFEKVVADAPLTRALRRLNVSLEGLPLEIPRQELADEETSRDGVIEALLASFYRQFPLARHDSRQVSALDQAALLQLRPRYAARVWTDLVSALRFPCGDGLVIFSNSRSLSDQLLVLAARLAGARAVIMELANLHPTRVDVDVLLSPSHFAKDHYSVATNVRARHKFVLSTGIDTKQFAPSATPLAEDGNVVIGYVGRLSSEKSLGILLAAMKILSPVCSHCRLRIVGDGPQKAQLRHVALEWGLLGTSVEFVDGIYNDEPALVRQLRAMHVFASPMFTETLGLAVLEAMSVGLPVVGFISGGTSEFLEDGVNCVSVTTATAEGFAHAILALANDKELRLRLGRRARHTVEERFSTHKALEQYATLYERVGRPLRESVSSQPVEECTVCGEAFCELEYVMEVEGSCCRQHCSD
ncbi:Sulfoquinovosyl transferase SQD2 [Phytophthora ramorum]|uniref:Sulfoquinovosyl transferase SQD2 n=1 Tax=Phytophthora ramorum TaxID=164328 RepID=UPI0030A00CEA|nr:Sulfoquinovosyl transferase SQD2 [Phytophthora ramorum]